MPPVNTPRLQIPVVQLADAADIGVALQPIANIIDKLCNAVQNTEANLPAPSAVPPMTLFTATDSQKQWVSVNPGNPTSNISTAWLPFPGPGTVGTNQLIDGSVTSQKLLSAGAGIFGDGSDGTATCDGATTVAGMSRVGSTYTLTRDIYFDQLTVNGGITVLTNGFRIFCKTKLTNSGSINNDGFTGATGSNIAGGAFTVGSSAGSLGGGGAGAGGGNPNTAGSASTNQNLGGGGIGGVGGTASGHAGGAAGTVGSALVGGIPRATPMMVLGRDGAAQQLTGGSGGSGGGGAGSGGGGGGSAGGVVLVATRNLINNGTISANGGAGGITSPVGGAGGGGGGGGVVMLIYGIKSGSGTVTVSGGAGGVTSGGNGSNGNAGTILDMLIA